MRTGTSQLPAWRGAMRVVEELHPGYVFVDCFGTVLHRRVPAAEVRRLACHDLARRLGLDVPIEDLVAMRRQAERTLVQALSEDGAKRDCRIDSMAWEVYPTLSAHFCEPAPSLEDFVALMVETELAVEAAVTVPNGHALEFLRSLPAGTQRVLLSDTRLPEAVLSELLARHQLDDLFEVVGASCDAGETKRSGRLYGVMLDRLGVAASKVVMVGDDRVADVERAQERGLNAVHIPPGPWERVRDAPRRTLEREFRRRLRDAAMPSDDADVFPEIALTLLYATHRLWGVLNATPSAPVLFLAREGQLLQRLFDVYQDLSSVAPRQRRASEYLLVSRRATSLDRTDVRDHGDQGRLLKELLPSSGGVALVDVGWKGTVQDNLSALAPELSIDGYYVGLVSGSPIRDLERKHALVFSNQGGRTPYFQVFNQFRVLMEVLLSADHGSVLRYERSSAGAPSALLDDDAAESACFELEIRPLQDRIEARFRAMAGILASARPADEDLLPLVARAHARMMYRPRVAELDFVDRLIQVDSFGPERVKRLGLVSNEPTGRRQLGRRHVTGGGWPPLRMRAAGSTLSRHAYGAYKMALLRLGRLD